MIVYSGTIGTFLDDNLNGCIAERIDQLFRDFGIRHESIAEFRSWENSLSRMSQVLNNDKIDKSVKVAIEYQIPLTSKRVDFMIGGNDGKQDNIVIIELKQWEKCEVTDKEDVVIAFTGGALREVNHPSQQAYSYAKLIESFNIDLRENNIHLFPCAYLHNFKEEFKNEIMDERYQDMIKEAPVFLRRNGIELQNFILKYVSKPSNKDLFQIVEYGKLKPSKALQDVVGSLLDGNEEYIMIDEQQVAFATILDLYSKLSKDGKKHTIIVQGGPGTGKTVIAMNLLSRIINMGEEGSSCFYVTKTSAPRAVFSKKLIKGKHKLTFLRGLFKGSGEFIDSPNNAFDCLLVDEAHRLNAKSGMFSNKGENQIKEIIHAARISVFFIDENQMVTTKDIGTINEIEKWAKYYNSQIHENESLILKSQFRCNGSDGYIAFLDDVLQIRETANFDGFDLDFDIKVFDNPCEMREELRKHNGNNKARMIAGYCYPWISHDDKSLYDIVLPHNFKAQWNFDQNQFAIASDSFEQVGCIHSTQGLEFDYVGIIIGLDLRFDRDTGKVITDYTKRAKQDSSIKGIKSSKNYKLADQIIRNTYKTLLTRGQKGCFIYCEDEELREYLKERLKLRSKNY